MYIKFFLIPMTTQQYQTGINLFLVSNVVLKIILVFYSPVARDQPRRNWI